MIYSPICESDIIVSPIYTECNNNDSILKLLSVWLKLSKMKIEFFGGDFFPNLSKLYCCQSDWCCQTELKFHLTWPDQLFRYITPWRKNFRLTFGFPLLIIIGCVKCDLKEWIICMKKSALFQRNSQSLTNYEGAIALLSFGSTKVKIKLLSR